MKKRTPRPVETAAVKSIIGLNGNGWIRIPSRCEYTYTRQDFLIPCSPAACTGQFSQPCTSMGSNATSRCARAGAVLGAVPASTPARWHSARRRACDRRLQGASTPEGRDVRSSRTPASMRRRCLTLSHPRSRTRGRIRHRSGKCPRAGSYWAAERIRDHRREGRDDPPIAPTEPAHASCAEAEF